MCQPTLKTPSPEIMLAAGTFAGRFLLSKTANKSPNSLTNRCANLSAICTVKGG